MGGEYSRKGIIRLGIAEDADSAEGIDGGYRHKWELIIKLRDIVGGCAAVAEESQSCGYLNKLAADIYAVFAVQQDNPAIAKEEREDQNKHSHGDT